MRISRTWGAIGVAAIATSLFTGCTVAEAASPESKNSTPQPVATATATPTPAATATVTPEHVPPVEDVPPPWSWNEIDGEWCTDSQALCFTVYDSTYDQMGEHYVIQDTGAAYGCFQAEVSHHTYEGAHVLYCPADTPTPFWLINSAATTAEEAVYLDDPSRDRLWLYNAVGPVTYFRQ
ncbi:hypothetical protein [Microbacterium sp. HMWF026]|uniref:hypothetical protein n=1 Tax=Microbacterium sp. HMWF026 TaxID=2056861 RepID=UPI0011B238B4|nr:hypothetical protein [Microbacterium sp. HMWF026]